MWFFTSDLHGQSSLYEQLLGIVAAHGPEAVLIGGDLCPHALGEAGVSRQRVFLSGFVVEFARRLREASSGTRLLLMMGNDDWASNHDCLEQLDGDLWRVLHERVTEIDGVRVAGCSWVPITPFTIKDWERWEDGGPEAPPRLDGFVSAGAALETCRLDPERRSPSIADSLDELARAAPLEGAVLVTHSPPRDTACDVTAGRAHVGSRAIRAFVERERPGIVLSGHIHESPRVSGSFRDTIGRSVVVNPGQFGTSRLCGVWFDPAQPAESLRHTVF